ncbi:MAG: zf-HC2 domain-containing protein [Anaerolineae bacterium]|nr:zf-HC2 domain-containing protein [Anaerolineae bacterium]
MNEHISDWLGAYHDGELNDRKLQIVETHLETCAQCLAQVEALQDLSVLIQASPTANNLLPPDIFTSQVGLRMSRMPEASYWAKFFRTSWKALPFGILTAWVVLQAIYVVSGVVMLTLRIIPGMQQYGLNLLQSTSILAWSFLLNLGLTLLMGLSYWSWLASWWIRVANGNNIKN